MSTDQGNLGQWYSNIITPLLAMQGDLSQSLVGIHLVEYMDHEKFGDISRSIPKLSPCGVEDIRDLQGII